jgi:hypothetical protein
LRADGTNFVATTATFPDTAGSSGNVLTSDGTNWSSTAPTTSIPSPLKYISIIDDLLTNDGQFKTDGTTSMVIVNPGTETTHPGVFTNTGTFAVDIGMALKDATSARRSIFLGVGELTFNCICKIGVLSDATNTYTFRCGMMNALTSATTDGLFFTYTHGTNSGKYVANAMTSSVSTTGNSNNTVNTNWVNLGITVNAAGTSASFFVDGVEITNSPIITNIPTTAALRPVISCQRSAGTGQINTLYVDLIYVLLSLTTSR